jgi:hypothetical protein
LPEVIDPLSIDIHTDDLVTHICEAGGSDQTNVAGADDGDVLGLVGVFLGMLVLHRALKNTQLELRRR